MSQTDVGELSATLFFPGAFVLYIAAMLAYFYGVAFTRVDRSETDRARAGRAAGVIGVGLLSLGLAVHLASIITRSMASGGRVPWGNMYEYSSVSGFGIALIALLVVHWRLRRPELVGFLLFGGLMTMAAAQVLYVAPGPLQPALQTHWLKIHTFGAMGASTIFTVAFVFTGLYLLRDLAEQRLAEARTSSLRGSTVGAVYAPGATAEGADRAEQVERPEGFEEDDGLEERDVYGRALRGAINPLPIAASAATLTLIYSLLFRNPVASIVAPLVVGVGVLVAWWLLPALPSAATLDSLAYRTTAFAFPVWTFAVIAGAVWAEQSWGRYWGWDPKETGAFLTWVAYAGYLHARATRGLRGRGAAGIGVLAFLILMFTYYAVNLWIAGLHSYQGTGVATSNPPYFAIAAAIVVWVAIKVITKRSSAPA